MTATLDQAALRMQVQNSRCVLRRRQPRVVVRAPEATPGRFPKLGQERRARVSTLIGIGAREAMPTLFDIDNVDEPPTSTTTRSLGDTTEMDTELSIALEQWCDDEDDTCFDD